MGFMRRLLGGKARANVPAAAAINPGDVDAEERAYELELLRNEQERLDDLAQRQLRFADYALQPPVQGGERRADDHDAQADGR